MLHSVCTVEEQRSLIWCCGQKVCQAPQPIRDGILSAAECTVLVLMTYHMVEWKKGSLIWVAMLCKPLKIDWHFSGTCCLHLHCQKPSKKWVWGTWPGHAFLQICGSLSVGHMMLHRSRRTLHNYRCENLMAYHTHRNVVSCIVYQLT
jgi:hypothetical protein